MNIKLLYFLFTSVYAALRKTASNFCWIKSIGLNVLKSSETEYIACEADNYCIGDFSTVNNYDWISFINGTKNQSCQCKNNIWQDCRKLTYTDGAVDGWLGCRGNGNWVCSELILEDYSQYFHHHKKCIPNPTCAEKYFPCSINCPEPTEADY